MTPTPAETALWRALNVEQQQAAIEGRVRDCHVNHPVGTRCPNCADWPFKKGGAADFVAASRAIHALGMITDAQMKEIEDHG